MSKEVSILALPHFWKFDGTALQHISTAINKERNREVYIFGQPIDLTDEKTITDVCSQIKQVFKECQNVELEVTVYPESNTMLLNRI